jgi:hypothetical protein
VWQRTLELPQILIQGPPQRGSNPLTLLGGASVSGVGFYRADSLWRAEALGHFSCSELGHNHFQIANPFANGDTLADAKNQLMMPAPRC